MCTTNDTQHPRVEAEAEIYALYNRGIACAVLETVKEESDLIQLALAVLTISMTKNVTYPEKKVLKLIIHRDLMKNLTMKKVWLRSYANQFVRLAQKIKFLSSQRVPLSSLREQTCWQDGSQDM